MLCHTKGELVRPIWVSNPYLIPTKCLLIQKHTLNREILGVHEHIRPIDNTAAKYWIFRRDILYLFPFSCHDIFYVSFIFSV